MTRTAVAIKAKAAQTQASLDQLFESPLASQLEAMRHKARSKRRVVFDCFESRVVEDEEDGLRVTCPHNTLKHTRADGSITLKAVLRGSGLNVCQKCPKYDDEDEPATKPPKAREKDGYSKIAPVRAFKAQHPKVHILDLTRPARGVMTMCGNFCEGWVAVEGNDPVTCSKCLKRWQERR